MKFWYKIYINLLKENTPRRERQQFHLRVLMLWLCEGKGEKNEEWHSAVCDPPSLYCGSTTNLAKLVPLKLHK
jgi:hypothetical protein